MPITAFLHTHVLVVALFLLLFAAKALLLLLNKRDMLTRVRKSTRILDLVFGTLILVTGAYLVFQYNGGLPTWLIIKMVLVLIAIPAGIVGIRLENKALTVLALLLFGYVYGVAQTKSLTLYKAHLTETAIVAETPETDVAETGDAGLSESAAIQEGIVAAMSETQLANAKAIYTQACANCHGATGAKGVGGATNLTKSKLSLNDRKNVIANGRGLMPAFNSQLSEPEVEMLAAYTLTLKNL
ncbi:SirB2 family protein [Pontibacter chitinilyticus]|uniref:SirB2 family protein n=1 Tax=Pontibacter chitinilyticus TaxID=2674989 RepID=UPI00321A2B0A